MQIEAAKVYAGKVIRDLETGACVASPTLKECLRWWSNVCRALIIAQVGEDVEIIWRSQKQTDVFRQANYRLQSNDILPTHPHTEPYYAPNVS